jgi:CBS domain-containing protein
MRQWQVSDVMTTDVVTALEDTSVREIVDLLATHRVSAVPIIGDGDRVVGVVSEADLLAKVAARGPAGRRRSRRRRQAMAHATTARGLMSTPALGIAPDASLSAAARKLQATKVKRLLVTGDTGQLLGVVSRADLLRVYARPDAAIGRDVTDDVLRRTLWLDTDQVHACVQGGVVTLAGAVGRRSTAAIAARLTGHVPGVTAVVDNIRYEFDDTALARSRVHRTHPFSAAPFHPTRP